MHSGSSIVSRFAPSPTGQLHLGNARTAFFAFLAARGAGGRFILRSEDTDRERSREALLAELLDDLRWLGLEWEEGPDRGGPHAPYRQSERAAIYATWIDRLGELGRTYPCYCTQIELAVARRSQLAAGRPPRYAGTCRELTSAERAAREAKGLTPSLRFRVPPGEQVRFTDLVHGLQVFDNRDIGDFVIRRADGSAAFFLSNALDDALMGVNLVLRGDDHLANTPRQIMILTACGLPVPAYAHVSMILGQDDTPLSKRHGATGLHELRSRGYLPGAVCNHLLRLGHTPSREGWVEPGDLSAAFDLGRLGRAPARFDEAQLRHWQREALTHASPTEIARWLAPMLPASLSDTERERFALAIRGNIELPQDAREWWDALHGSVTPFTAEAEQAIRAAGPAYFETALRTHAQLRNNAGAPVRELTRLLGSALGLRGTPLYLPLRAALSGRMHGPDLTHLYDLLGAPAVERRLEQALAMTRSHDDPDAPHP